MQDWYLGYEAGSSLAAILMGDVNPSGKLPFTFPVKLEDCPAHSLGEYTGKRSKDIIDIKYNESIFVGYRWADKQKKVKPLFPFGHGLSYTTFEYGKPTADSKTMQADGTLTVKRFCKEYRSARSGRKLSNCTSVTRSPLCLVPSRN